MACIRWFMTGTGSGWTVSGSCLIWGCSGGNSSVKYIVFSPEWGWTSMSVSLATSAVKRLADVAASSRKAGSAMSVAIYLHDLAGGGVERQSLIIAEEFRRHGADVTLVLHRLRGQLLDQVPA